MLKRLSKSISCILVVSMFLSGVPVVGGATTAKPALVTKDGFVEAEAENLKYNTANFDLVSGQDMSGGKAIAANNEDKTVPDINSEPDIDLSFLADKAGTYSLWLRNKASDSSSGNSVFMSVNKGEYKYTLITGKPTEFAWTKLGSITISAGEFGSFRLTRRQRNSIVLDKFIISNNKLFTPTGMGGDPHSMEGTKLPDDVYPKPTITPPPQHPRLMFTAKDIVAIKANFQAAQNKAAYEAWQKSLANKIDGKLVEPSKVGATNYNANILTVIEALAIDNAINKNEESGKNAVSAMINYAHSIVFDDQSLSYRFKGHVIFIIAVVYDWCYDLLNENEKKELIALGESIASGLAMGYPPKGQGAVSGHGGENNLLRDLLAFGIAIYNERPDI